MIEKKRKRKGIEGIQNLIEDGRVFIPYHRKENLIGWFTYDQKIRKVFNKNENDVGERK